MKEKTYPRAFVFKEKHGEAYYLINTPEEFAKMWLQILKERFEDHWYDWMKDYVPYNFNKLKYTQEDINRLSENMQEEKERMLKALKAQERQLNEQRKIRANYYAIERAIENNSGLNAYRLLDEFSDGEYARFEEIWFQPIK